MQMLAKDTDQLSFVAEPEISYGFLEKLDAFKIADDKLLFVVSLDSGLDKTVILRCDNKLSAQQLRVLVKYVNEELAGLRIYDIQSRYLGKLYEKRDDQNRLLNQFLIELNKAFSEISSYFLHFDGSISFLEQSEFNSKEEILKFLGFIQRQDLLINILQKNDFGKPVNILMGEDFGRQELQNYALIFARYELFGVPGYLGVLAPIRMNYLKNIVTVREFARIITETTKKGMMVPQYE